MASPVDPLRFAGVLARHRGRVALVRQRHDDGQLVWSLPGGRVEPHETPEQGAVRELREETGLVVSTARLGLVSTVSVAAPAPGYGAWNFVVDVEDPALAVDDPDGLVEQASWFAVEEAVRLLTGLPYRPMSEPSVAMLTEPGTDTGHWAFPSAGEPPVRHGLRSPGRRSPRTSGPASAGTEPRARPR